MAGVLGGGRRGCAGVVLPTCSCSAPPQRQKRNVLGGASSAGGAEMQTPACSGQPLPGRGLKLLSEDKVNHPQRHFPE